MTKHQINPAISVKPDLEDHIDSLRELDKLRVQSGKLRDIGLNALAEWKDYPQNDPLITAAAHSTRYCYSKKPDKDLFEKLKDSLKKLPQLPPQELEHPEKHPLSLVEAARQLKILAIAPGFAYSNKTLYCFYWIVRELYSANVPDWSIGGLGAVPGGKVSACMTSCCLHALLDFANSQNKVAEIVKIIGKFAGELANLQAMPSFLDKWKDEEYKRLYYSFYVALQPDSKFLALDFELPEAPVVGLKYHEVMQSYIDAFLKNLTSKISNVHASFEQVINEIEHFHTHEVGDRGLDKERLKSLDRSALGHHIALSALMDGKELSEALRNELNGLSAQNVSNKEHLGDSLADKMFKAADDTKKFRHVVESFLKSVLEHQLNAADSGGYGMWEADEMVFAAEGLVALDEKRWAEDPRLTRALGALSGVISDRGRFPVTLPYHYERGGGLMADQVEIIWNFSELSRKLLKSHDIEIDLIRKLLHFFEDCFVDKTPCGWCEEHAPLPHKPDLPTTIGAVKALASLNLMLDERINSIVLKHFMVKYPESPDLKLNLDQLFYPDYGLSLISKKFDELKTKLKEKLAESSRTNDDHHQEKTLELSKDFELLATEDILPKQSIAITLQKMRAHVINAPDIAGVKPVHSIVLHGPPGTGKTFLVEALAKSCNVPMVEVTPSDLVIGGMEAVERKARTVFEALSLLTRVVILFDEFDPVLLRRNPDGQTPNNVFSFLTPGMLPKLKTLYNRAEKRSVAYVLNTNLIGSLDEAAVRKGRFDEKIGVYPPDVLSRTGRLYHQYCVFTQRLEDFKEKKKKEGQPIKFDLPDDNNLKTSIFEIVKKTAGGPMDSLGKPKWFTAPEEPNNVMENSSPSENKLKDTPFGKMLCNKEFQKPEPEALLTGILGKGKTAIKEWMQWKWINCWDEEFEPLTTESELESKLRNGPSLPSGASLFLRKFFGASLPNKRQKLRDR